MASTKAAHFQFRRTTKASVLLQIIIFAGIAIIALLYIRDHSTGSLKVQNTSGNKSPEQLEVRAINPVTSSIVDTIPLSSGGVSPGAEVSVSLESVAWHKVNLEIWDSTKNAILPGRSETVFVVPGGSVLAAKLTTGGSSNGWIIGGWNQ